MKTLQDKREEMTKESWIKNVLRIYPEKTQEEAEKLYERMSKWITKN